MDEDENGSLMEKRKEIVGQNVLPPAKSRNILSLDHC